jgi:uncharacterized protein YndB with AHSA1/START domain
MSEQATTIEPIVRTVTVDAPVDTCFRTFVERWAEWWPPEHHIGQDREITELHLEGKVGGRAYDIDTRGVECQWGTVIAFDPPKRLVIAWHIQPDFTTIDRDVDRSSEVEVTFTAAGDGRTEVRLVHGRLERHGAGAGSMHGSVGNDEGGWGFLIRRFADVAEGRPPRLLPAAPADV